MDDVECCRRKKITFERTATIRPQLEYYYFPFYRPLYVTNNKHEPDTSRTSLFS